ncbi:30S ribosomal protein S6 [Gammaproteobacteria bacterium]|nr:30S ribosomal protein S6 [Gammaproteobacteria bacterium]
MRHYEIVLLVHPKKSDSIKELLEEYKNIISKGNGIVHRCEESGRRELAYLIEKHRHAYFIVTNIEVSADTLNDIKYQLRFNTAVMRSLVAKQNKAIIGSSLLLATAKQSKES